MRKRTYVIAGFILFMLAVSVVGIVVVGQKLRPRFVMAIGQVYYQKVREQWQQRIKEVGTVQAYKEAKVQMGRSISPVAHGVMHVFGELVYEADGLDGLRVCDDAYNYGCFHGFIAWAINYEGPGAVAQISQRCKQLYGEDEILCGHGIGHGLLDYYGPDHLSDALEECRKVGNISLMGCYNGAMMEFVNGEGYSTQRLSLSHPYEPCASLSADFRQACYFHMPFWWNWKTSKDARRVDGLCDGITDEAERTACLLGAGKTMVELSAFDARKAVKYCGKLKDEAEKLICNAGAYSVATATHHATYDLCKPFSADMQQTCVAMAARVGYDTPVELRKLASELHP